ncbi:MAG: hypothetical protein U0838_12940 [Chloroflexota bacterium]
MTNRAQKYACGRCPAVVRRIGRHTNQKHPGQPVLAEKAGAK